MKPKLVLIAVAAAGVIAAGSFLFQGWRASSALEEEVAGLVARAQMLFDSGDRLSDAKVELDKALKRSPSDVAALELRARVQFALSMAEAAQADVELAMKSLAGDALGRAKLLYGDILTERYRGSGTDDHFRMARDAYFEAQRIVATKAAALYGYAMLLLEKGKNRDLDKGFAELESLVKQFPDAPEAQSAKALLADVKRPAPAGD